MADPAHPITSAFATGGSGFLGRNLLRALRDREVPTRALARSAGSAAVVEELGATAVRGGLLDKDALRAGMEGCSTVFHCAAFVGDWCRGDEADRLNVGGTAAVLGAARAAGVDTVVHVSTEAVLVGGPPIRGATEDWPLPDRPLGVYPRTKGEAEREVQRAVADGQRAVIVRPRFIWGNDDTTLLPRLVEAAEQGVLRWIDGGDYPTSTCHVDNVVEGMLLAAERGRSGGTWFLTDGDPVSFRWMVSEMLKTRGIDPPSGTVPAWLLRALGGLCEAAWLLPLPGAPPLTRTGVALIESITVSDARARAELGYQGRTSIEAGLADLRARAG